MVLKQREPNDSDQWNDTGRTDSDLVDEATSPPPERAFGTGLLVGALIAVAAVIFIVQNHDSVALDWLIFDWRMPLWIALCGAILVGLLAYPLAVMAFHGLRQRSERRMQATDELRRRVGGKRGRR